MTDDYHLRQRSRAHKMISRRGLTGILRRDNADRTCYIIEDAYNPNRPSGASAQNLARFYLVSALTVEDGATVELSPPPDNHLDRLIVSDSGDDSGELELIIVQPPGRLAPGGIVIYYELACERP